MFVNMTAHEPERNTSENAGANPYELNKYSFGEHGDAVCIGYPPDSGY